MSTAAKIYTVLGTTDSVTACDCCGRTGLKSTVVLLHIASDAVQHFGAACGAKAAGWATAQLVKAASMAQAERERATRRRLNELTAATDSRIMAEMTAGRTGDETQPARFARWARERATARATAWQTVANENPEALRPAFY